MESMPGAYLPWLGSQKGGSRRMSRYPELIFPDNHVEPVPRRIRGMLHDHVVLDSTEAIYVWDSPYYPQYYIPMVA